VRLNSGVGGLFVADVVLAEERYSHVLFRREGQHLLTYLSGGPIEVDRTVVLPPDLAASLSESPADLKALVYMLLAGAFPTGVVQAASAIWPAP
jgi:hypothetical protein